MWVTWKWFHYENRTILIVLLLRFLANQIMVIFPWMAPPTHTAEVDVNVIIVTMELPQQIELKSVPLAHQRQREVPLARIIILFHLICNEITQDRVKSKVMKINWPGRAHKETKRKERVLVLSYLMMVRGVSRESRLMMMMELVGWLTGCWDEKGREALNWINQFIWYVDLRKLWLHCYNCPLVESMLVVGEEINLYSSPWRTNIRNAVVVVHGTKMVCHGYLVI